MAILKELFSHRIELGDDGSHMDALLTASVESIDAQSGFSGTITDKAGHKRTYQDGKEVASHQDPTPEPKTGPGARTGDDHAEQPDLGGLEDSLTKADPETARKPGVLEWAKQKAITAAAHVMIQLYKHHDAINAVAGLAGDVFDAPSDMAKFGYNPAMSSQTSSGEVAKGMDPMQAHLGISTHFAATVAAKVLSAGLNLIKKKFGGAKKEADQIDQAAEGLHQVFAVLAEQFGLPAPPPPATIAAALRKLQSPQPATPSESIVVNLAAPPAVNVTVIRESAKKATKKTHVMERQGEGRWKIVTEEAEEPPKE